MYQLTTPPTHNLINPQLHQLATLSAHNLVSLTTSPTYQLISLPTHQPTTSLTHNLVSLTTSLTYQPISLQSHQLENLKLLFLFYNTALDFIPF